MAIPLRFRALPRRNPCSVYRCRNRDTYLIHRGQDVNHNTLYLCEDCIRDIVAGYIDTVGEERARDTLAESLKRLPLEESSDDAKPETAIPYQAEHTTAKTVDQKTGTCGNQEKKPEDNV